MTLAGIIMGFIRLTFFPEILFPSSRHIKSFLNFFLCGNFSLLAASNSQMLPSSDEIRNSMIKPEKWEKIDSIFKKS